MRHCRIMPGPLRVPTLMDYPPPVAEVGPTPPLMTLPAVRSAALPDAPVRSPVRRRARECVFIPDMDIALQFIEGRRRAAEAAGLEAPPGRSGPSALSAVLESPVVLGLLMMVVPPLAVTLLWSRPRLSRPAQIALTLYGALTTLVLGAIVVASRL
jgi:hypothetical protein